MYVRRRGKGNNLVLVPTSCWGGGEGGDYLFGGTANEADAPAANICPRDCIVGFTSTTGGGTTRLAVLTPCCFVCVSNQRPRSVVSPLQSAALRCGWHGAVSCSIVENGASEEMHGGSCLGRVF